MWIICDTNNETDDPKLPRAVLCLTNEVAARLAKLKEAFEAVKQYGAISVLFRDTDIRFGDIELPEDDEFEAVDLGQLSGNTSWFRIGDRFDMETKFVEATCVALAAGVQWSGKRDDELAVT